VKRHERFVAAVVLVSAVLTTAGITLWYDSLDGPSKVPVVCGSPPPGAWLRYVIQTTDGPGLGGAWRDDPSLCYYYPTPQNAHVELRQWPRRAGGR
jgi:hypothetical protein